MTWRWRIGLAGLVVLVGCTSTTTPNTAPAPATANPATATPPTPATVPAPTGPPVTDPPPPVLCPPATTTVATANELRAALASATPGAVIVMQPGIYEGRFETTASATEAQPIHLCGPADAVLDGGDKATGTTLHLDGVVAWRLIGFTVRHGQKGIVTDETRHTVLENLRVEDVGDEAIHLRGNSSDNTIRGTTIRGTGSFQDIYGEGIYVGSAQSHWCEETACQPDRGDRNLIENNDIGGTTSESIDIKEGTTGGVVRNNVFDGSSTTSEVAWLSVKGNNWLIEGNRGEHAPVDGYQVYRAVPGWGTGHVFRGNVSNVDAAGYAFNTHNVPDTVIACDNIVTGAGKGLADVPCSG